MDSVSPLFYSLFIHLSELYFLFKEKNNSFLSKISKVFLSFFEIYCCLKEFRSMSMYFRWFCLFDIIYELNQFLNNCYFVKLLLFDCYELKTEYQIIFD